MTTDGVSTKLLSADVASGLTNIVASGATSRGPSPLCRDELWQEAVDLILSSKTVAVVTGFYVPAAMAPETDGPPGASVLARAIERTGRSVEIWTDAHCLYCVKACADALSFPNDSVRDATDYGGKMPDLLVYVERLGRASDGRYYNMRMEDITEWTSPLDEFALRDDARVLSVGDGGNEVGMGCYLTPLSGMMLAYSSCLCSVNADVCLPVDVSNWGAYAIAAALSAVCGKWLAQTRDEDSAMFDALLASGAVDGVTKKNETSVDGLDMKTHMNIRDELESLVMRG